VFIVCVLLFIHLVPFSITAGAVYRNQGKYNFAGLL
jgi:hypothetical protein